jgi:hypothetical protein
MMGTNNILELLVINTHGKLSILIKYRRRVYWFLNSMFRVCVNMFPSNRFVQKQGIL